MLTTTIEERTQTTGGGKQGAYRWDAGAVSESLGAVRAGARESVIGSGYQLTRELNARNDAKLRGDIPMTEELFVEEGHDKWMDYSDDLYPEVIEARRDYRVGAMVNDQLSKDNSWYGNLALNMLGSTGADLPFMLAPAGLLTKGAQATTKGLLTGKTVQKASQMEQALAAGQVTGIRRLAAKELGQKAVKEQFVENSAIYWANKYFDGDYQEADFALDMAIGPVIAEVLGSPAIFRAKRVARINRGILTDKAALETAVEHGDVQGIAKILERNSSDFRNAVDADPELTMAMQMSWTDLNADVNVSKKEKLKQFLSENEDALWYQNLRGIIPRDMNLPAAEGVAKQVRDQQAIIKATVTGRYEDLTGEQLEFVLEADARTDQQRRMFEEDQRTADAQEVLDTELAQNKPTQGIEPPRRIVQEVTERYKNLEADTAVVESELKAIIGRKKPKKSDKRKLEDLKELKILLEDARTRQKVIEPMVTTMEDGMGTLRVLKNTVSDLALRGKERKALPLLKRSSDLLDEMEEIMEQLADSSTNTFEISALNIRAKDIQKALENVKKDTLKLSGLRAPSSKGKPKGKGKGKGPKDGGPKDGGPKDGGTKPKTPKPRTPEVQAPKTAPNIEVESAQLEMKFQENKVERAKAAAGRRAEKRREVDKRQKTYAKTDAEQASQNTTNVGKYMPLSTSWVSNFDKNVGDSNTSFRNFLVNLMEEPPMDPDISIEKLLDMAVDEKLEFSKDVFRDMFAIKTTHAKARGVGANFFKNPEKNLGFIGPDNLDEGLSRKLNQLYNDVLEGRIDSGEAAQTYSSYVDQMESGAILRRAHSETVYTKKRAEVSGFKPKEIIKYLKSSLDGLNRIGVNLKAPAVQHAINAEITISQAPMHEVLTKYKLFDAFTDPNNELMSDIMEANRTGEIPDKWKGENQAMFKDVLETYQKTTEALNGELNQYGANLRFLEGHSGVSQRWDGQTLLAAGFNKFSAHMLEAMDWDATRRNLGGVIAKNRDENGFTQDWTAADQMKYLTAMYDDLTAPRSEVDHPSMDIAKSFGKHRNIVIKPDMEVETMSLYSGHDSMGQLWLDQVRYKAEMVALTRELGNNPIPTFRRVVKDSGLSEAKNSSRKKNLLGSKLHEMDLKTLDWTLTFLTGKLDNPANIEVAQFGKTTRQLSHIVYMWQSTMSAVTDIPMAIHTVSQLGGTAPTSAMVKAFSRALKRRFYGNEPNMSSYLSQHGANFDAMMSAGSRHMGLPDSKTNGSVISKLSEATFSLNGLNAWTGIMQEAFVDVMTRDMASSIRAGKIEPSLKLTLEAAGISESEFLGLGSFVENVTGVDRLNINNDSVDPQLRRNLMAFMAKYRDEAVMMPDASTSAMVRAGTQAGTFKGELMRTMVQYQAFPLAMNRIAARKFLVNAEGGRPWTTDQVTFSNSIGYISGMLAMAYVASVMKDISRGREPMHFGNMTGSSWLKLFNQSGVGGMAQSIMEVGSGNPKAIVAPIPSLGMKIAGADSLGEVGYRLATAPNVPLVAPVVQKAIAAVFPEAVGYHFDQLNTYHKMTTDQDPLFFAPR